jgi:elongation factor G
MVLMHSNSREEISEAFAGDIVALVGLKETAPAIRCAIRQAGDPGAMEFPEPVIEIAVEPKTKADQEKMGLALANRLAAEDPSFRVDRRRIRSDHHQGHGRAAPRHLVDPEARVQGRGQRRCAAGGLSRDDHQAAEIDYTHKKQTGGSGQFARVKFIVEPGENTGLVFEARSSAALFRRNTCPGVEKGLNSVMTSGPLSASRWST